MFRNIFFLFIIISIIPGLALSADNSEDLEIMLVTASRTPVSTNQIGSSFTVIDARQLKNRQLVSISEILRDVPGFSVSRNGVLGSSTQIRVRGSEANQVLVFIDGVEVNDLAQGGEFNFAHLLTSDIERIEVIRGPQSALWGSDALAGVINITSKRGAGPVSFSGFVEGGSFGTKRGGGNISGSGKNYHFNLAGSIIDSDGENISRQGDEDDGYENTSLSFSAGYEPNDDFSLSVTGRYTDATNQFDSIDFFVTGLPTDADNETDTVQYYGRIQAKLSLFNDQWQHILGSSISSTDNENFSAGIETTSNEGKKYKFDYQTNFFLETTDILNASHTFTFALEHEKEEFKQRGTATPFGDPNQDLQMDTTSIVGDYRVNVLDDLSLSGSVRHDINSDFQGSTTYRTTAAFVYPQTGTRLHASYGTGVKNPSFTERFGFFATSIMPFVGNASLKPEQSRGWEIGVDQMFMDEKIRLGFVYFNERLQDEINGFVFDASIGAFGGFTAQNVSGRSNREGVEVTAAIKLLDGLQLRGAYTYTDATEPDATGRQIQEVRRPHHIASLNMDYVFFNERAGLNLNINYNGEQIDLFFPPFPNPQQRVKLASFTLVSLTGSYQMNQNISLYGRIENLLDEEYEEVFGFQTPGIGVFAGVRFALQP
ncbi:MAG: TonB-dependent receptor [Proteobacteria bacterium]|nr:TonB-dependent receptor [Pseudomonadota bacterium]